VGQNSKFRLACFLEDPISAMLGKGSVSLFIIDGYLMRALKHYFDAF
jgi:hypothetical protein